MQITVSIALCKMPKSITGMISVDYWECARRLQAKPPICSTNDKNVRFPSQKIDKVGELINIVSIDSSTSEY